MQTAGYRKIVQSKYIFFVVVVKFWEEVNPTNTCKNELYQRLSKMETLELSWLRKDPREA